MMNQRLSFLFSILLISGLASAQENSPFSRYGLGDVYPSQNIINRAMGGITSVYGNPQSVNFSNPASYGELKIVTYDIGVTLDSRGLTSIDPVAKYRSVNLSPSYVALGLPLSRKHNMGLAFGLRPITKVSYNITSSAKVSGDSIQTTYEGEGGLYQAFVGLGKRWKSFSAGLNTGVMFGRKENSTRTVVVDTVFTYPSNSSSNLTYGDIFLNLGFQYRDSISKTTSIVFGLSGNLKQKMSARQSITRETFTYTTIGQTQKVDSVYTSAEESGKIELPMSYTAGIALHSSVYDKIGGRYDRSIIAVEYEAANWSQFKLFNQLGQLSNSWQLRVGGQLTPDPLSIKSYWNRATYRAGFFFGKEAPMVNGSSLPVTGFTLGAGIPVRKYRSFDNQFTVINTTLEFGKRGNRSNNITESFFRLSLGLNLSDVWFIKRKYD